MLRKMYRTPRAPPGRRAAGLQRIAVAPPPGLPPDAPRNSCCPQTNCGELKAAIKTRRSARRTGIVGPARPGAAALSVRADRSRRQGQPAGPGTPARSSPSPAAMHPRTNEKLPGSPNRSRLPAGRQVSGNRCTWYRRRTPLPTFFPNPSCARGSAMPPACHTPNPPLRYYTTYAESKPDTFIRTTGRPHSNAPRRPSSPAPDSPAGPPILSDWKGPHEGPRAKTRSSRSISRNDLVGPRPIHSTNAQRQSWRAQTT